MEGVVLFPLSSPSVWVRSTPYGQHLSFFFPKSDSRATPIPSVQSAFLPSLLLHRTSEVRHTSLSITIIRADNDGCLFPFLFFPPFFFKMASPFSSLSSCASSGHRGGCHSLPQKIERSGPLLSLSSLLPFSCEIGQGLGPPFFLLARFFRGAQLKGFFKGVQQLRLPFSSFLFSFLFLDDGATRFFFCSSSARCVGCGREQESHCPRLAEVPPTRDSMRKGLPLAKGEICPRYGNCLASSTQKNQSSPLFLLRNRSATPFPLLRSAGQALYPHVTERHGPSSPSFSSSRSFS